ncbi:MAG: zf-HC2 domain-containing protein [Acidobacteriota bacterium]
MKCKEFESLIDSYLDGALPDDKREIFEEHYFVCDKCYTSLVLIENLRNKNIRIIPGREKNFSFAFRPALFFASLILIVFTSLFLTDLNNRKGKLMDISGFSPPIYVEGENRGDNFSDMFREAMENYQSGNYQKAYSVMTSIEQGNPKIWYFRGILALLNGNNKDALKHFDQIIFEMPPSYYDEAIYYRGICYLRLNRKHDALKEFKTLASMFSPLRDKATEKIELLNKL